MSKKGFTLTELLVSVIFVMLIIAAASYTWFLGNESFHISNKTSIAYTQARSLETLLQTAASSTTSLKFRDTPLSNSGSIKYSHFYFEEVDSELVYKVSLYGDSSVLNPTTMEFYAIDLVQISVKDLGQKCQLNYRIESTDEGGPFYIEGGIVLNNINVAKFSQDNPGIVTLPAVLNFQATQI